MASVQSPNNIANELSKLDLNGEEVDRLKECLKEEEFRNLLCEYAKEISDPKNRQLYEEEISKLERERGVDVKFVKPNPGHVLKLAVETDNGEKKCFVNICSNEHIGKPHNQPSVQEGRRGMQWSIPHSVSQPRDDKDKAGLPCMVVDVVFHPDTYYLLQKNDRFRTMIHDTAMEAIERQHKCKLNRSDIKQPKLKFKGQPTASVIRSPIAGEETKSEEFLKDPLKPEMPGVSNDDNTKKNNDKSSKGDQLQNKKDVKKQNTKSMANRPKKSAKKEKKMERSVRTRQATFESGVKAELQEILGLDEMEKKDYIEPEYTIVHRGYSDMQDFVQGPNDLPIVSSTRPRELLLTIELPLLRSASGLRLEIFEERVVMECEKPAAYKLNVKLPYAVDDNKGHAKFDKGKRRLTLTLEVLPPPNERGFTGLMFVSREMKDACNSCVQEEMSRLAESLSTDDEIPEKEPEEKPKEDIHVLKSYRPSNHPSGLLHDGMISLHQQHGELWGKDYEKNWFDTFTPETDFGELKHTSDELVKLIECLDNDESSQFVRRRPSVRFHQDEAFVVVIISVKSIDPNTIWYSVGPTMFQMCCTSQSSDPRWKDSIFQVWLKWDKTLVDPKRSRVDVTSCNAVFLLRKHISSWREWPYLKAGFDENHCEIRTFVTEDNVNSMLGKIVDSSTVAQPVVIDCEVIADDEEVDLFAVRLTEKPKGNGEKETNIDQSNKTQVENVDTNNNNDDEEGRSIPATTNGQASETADVSLDAIDDESDKYDTAESSEETKGCEVKKHVTFASEVQTQSYDDSDDCDETNDQPRDVVQGVVTIDNADGTDVVVDHRTESAVVLENSALYDLDDDL